MKRADQQKPYDPKASVWIKDEKTHGYKEGLLVTGDINLENPAEKVVVAVGNRIHYRFEQDESLTKSATHSENAIKSI